MSVKTPFHRLAHLAVLAATALLIALPLLLGPAMPAAIAALAEATVEHRCACGMKVGRCGCPECEAALRPDLAASPLVIVRSSCDDAKFVRSALPPMTFPSSMLAPALPISRVDLAFMEQHAPPSHFLEPVKPPPRSRAV